MIEPNVRERLEDLLSAVVYAVRRTDKSDDDVAVGSFVQDNFRVAGRDDLRAMLRCDVSQQLVNLSLAQHFEMEESAVRVIAIVWMLPWPMV